MFKFENNKLVLIEKNKFPETQNLLNDFYNLPNQQLINSTEKYISELMQEEYFYPENEAIQFFLYAAIGVKVNWWNLEISDLHKTHYIEICKLSGKPVKLDANGNINSTEKFLRKLQKQANKVPLVQLLKKPTFSDNFQSARHLKGNSVELYRPKKSLHYLSKN